MAGRSALLLDMRNRERSDSDTSVSSSELPIGISHNSREEEDGEDSADFSNLDLDSYTLEMNIATAFDYCSKITCLNISANRLEALPAVLERFVNLRNLDVSRNNLKHLGTVVTKFRYLTTLIASNNLLTEKSLTDNFGTTLAGTLKVLSLSGNQLRTIPPQVFALTELRSLYAGGNRINHISKEICRLSGLRVLYLGGNELEGIPCEVGLLHSLQALSLCENRLTELPACIARLKNLKSLALHKNQLTTLPQEIVKLRGLIELSLRDNPLVVRFIRTMLNNPPTLLELAARTVKVNKISYGLGQIPTQLMHYLKSAQCCVNPKCKGVFFDARVEHVKFVDFCGIYRLPLLQYLCSPQCTNNNPLANSSSSEDEGDVPLSKMKRVLLG